MKGYVLALVFLSVMSLFADISISDVEVFSGYPWQEVVVGYKIMGRADDPIGGLEIMVEDNVGGKICTCKTLEGVDCSAGTHVIKWNASADGAKFESEDVVFTARIVPPPPLYCVVDLSGGTTAANYPVFGLDAVPSGGWTEEYRTLKLVLRRIDAGTFQRSNKREVTLTKPFYIGVFEVTQAQYELVMGSNPASHKGNVRPVETVSYNRIRGNLAGNGWPANRWVYKDSFLGKLRMKTGLDFDLPTEAQWEYACRAGTTSAYNNGGSTENDLNLLGRYSGNKSDGRGCYNSAYTERVGSYLPNAWGLYDMHGNVSEWCLDWYGSSVGAGIDPVGEKSGSSRVQRGGSYYHAGSGCSSSARGHHTSPGGSNAYDGFRIVRRIY